MNEKIDKKKERLERISPSKPVKILFQYFIDLLLNNRIVISGSHKFLLTFLAVAPISTDDFFCLIFLNG